MTKFTGIPTGLCPLVRVRAVGAGLDPRSYLTRTVGALLRYAAVEMPPLPGLAQTVTADQAAPVLADYGRLLEEVVPLERRAAVAAAHDELLGTLRALYPLPAADHLVSDVLTVLAEPFESSQAGTVVYQRTTTMGVVDFILPHLVAVPSKGTFYQVDLPVPAAPAEVRPRDVESDQVLTAALTVAQNLAFALPPPWGPVTAAGLSLLEMLIPNHRDNPFEAAVKSIKALIQQQVLASVASYLNQYGTWLHELQGQQEMLGIDPVFMKKAIASLEEATSANSPLFSGLAQMNGLADADDDALKLLVLAESIYTVSLKMTIQFYAKLAEVAEDSKDDAEFAYCTDAWYGAYAGLLVHIQGADGTPGCALRIASLVQDRSTKRLSQITSIYRYDHREFQDLPNGRVATRDTYGWTYQDAAAGDNDLTHFHPDTMEGECCTSQYQVEHQADAQADHDQYVHAITTDLDNRFGKAAKTAQAWSSSIQVWNQNMPPRRPAAPPAVPKSASWPDPAPPDTVWASYAQVHYAVAYANNKGPSPLSGWSDTVDISGRAHPAITLPKDPFDMATVWRVYRQFMDAAGKASPPRVIAVIPCGASAEFKDIY